MKHVHPKGAKTREERTKVLGHRKMAASGMKWAAVGAIIVVTILLVFQGWNLIDIRGNNVGDKPYNFTLKSCDGPTYSLNDDLGQKPILLEFARHDCIHCIHMCDVVNALYANYSSRAVFVTVISDKDPAATMQDVREFKYSHNSDWTFVLDPNGAMWEKYGCSGWPTFFMVGKDGKIHWTNKTPDPQDMRGEFTYIEMEQNLTKVL
jgi:peroxiredoxin